ncbi:MAG: YeeE/YedE family protein [Pseudomonadota bacterium]
MSLFEYAWTVPIAALLVGAVMGFVARWSHFCALAALERHWYADDSRGLRSWGLAAGIALFATLSLQMAGFIDISQSFYLTEPAPLLGAIAGGLMFGVGMALVGTCGFGAVVRFGGGNLRALVVLTGMGLAAIAAQRGITAYGREWFLDPFALDLQVLGLAAKGSPLTVSSGVTSEAAIGLLIAAALMFWCLKDRAFRLDSTKLVAGTVIGLCVAAGWYVTSTAQQVGFEPFQVEAGSFVAPVGDTILQIIMVTGQGPDYGVGLVVGVFVGAAFAAWKADDMRWEACDDARELGRHLLGAFLMGTGGVFALGCTIGQGISAVSALSLSAPLAIVSMIFGARIGLSLLVEGRMLAFLRAPNEEKGQHHPAE